MSGADVPASPGACAGAASDPEPVAPTSTPLDGVPAGLPGRRPDLVLLPGMLGDVTAWAGVAAEMVGVASIRMSRIDLDDSVGELATAVLGDAPAQFALAGHSLGGIVALEVARRAPQRVTRLALLNCSARPPSDVQLSAWSGWRDRVVRGQFVEVVRELAVLTLPEHRRDDANLVARGEHMGVAVGEAGFLRQLAAQQTRPDSRLAFSSIKVPTLVIAGEVDQVCPASLQRELAEGIDGAELVLLSGTGHMSILEDPGAVAAVLAAWLR